jgi:hypothetical protein
MSHRLSNRSSFHARLEPLEDRRFLSGDPSSLAMEAPDDHESALVASPRSDAIADAPGDFLSTYTGPHDPGLDVLKHQVTVVGDRVIFYGKMAGRIEPTRDVGGLYLFGVDRGRGTPRFRNGTPVIGPNVTWDLIVRINPDGTGLVNNQVMGVVTPLDPADIRIDGNHFTASVPLSLLLNGATRPPEEWTYNLWPRNGIIPGQNQHVSDLAPDDGNSPVRVLSGGGSPDYGLGTHADAALAQAEAGTGAAADGAAAGRAAGDDLLGTDDRSPLE